jgi:hypothetical protein
MIVLINEQVYKTLLENLQMADKLYFNTGILSPEDREIILKVTNGDYFTKAVCDILVNSGQKPNLFSTKTLYDLLKEYNNSKEFLPIPEFDILKLDKLKYVYVDLFERARVIKLLNDMNPIYKRNLKPIIQRSLSNPADYEQFMILTQYKLKDIINLTTEISDRKPKQSEEIIENAINSSKTSLDDIVTHLRTIIENLKDEVIDYDDINKLEYFAEDIDVILDDDDILLVNIFTPDAMKAFGCHTDLCITSDTDAHFYFGKYVNRDGGILFLEDKNTDRTYVFVSGSEVFTGDNSQLDIEEVEELVQSYNIESKILQTGFELQYLN